MIVIDNIMVSDDVVEKQFVCDLNKCKGGCCEEGDAGAPLEKEELDLIIRLLRKNKALPYQRCHQLKLKKMANMYIMREFGWVTPTLASDNEICAYGFRDEKGIIKCAFEQAYYDGVIPWKKPVSCHLYPVIASKGKHGDYDKVNYEPRETMCNPACSLGKKTESAGLRVSERSPYQQIWRTILRSS